MRRILEALIAIGLATSLPPSEVLGQQATSSSQPTIRLRIAGSSVYDQEVETPIKEALIFDTLEVFVGQAKNAIGGVGRLRVGTYAVFVYLSNQERGCGRLQDAVTAVPGSPKRTEKFARYIARTKPEPNAPFVPFDASDLATFDLQLLGLDVLGPLDLAPFDGKQVPRWKYFAYGYYSKKPEPIVRVLLSSGGTAFPECPDPAKGWISTVEEADRSWCHDLPLQFTKEQRESQTWSPVRDFIGNKIGGALELWNVVRPDSAAADENPKFGQLESGYRVIASIDAKAWSLHADVPAKRCSGLRHIQIEPK